MAERKFRGKGPLSVALIVTQHAKRLGLPLDPESLLTEGGGQVQGLGKGAVQAVLSRHGITKVLAAEGGRTSRGSISNMREYVAFLNTLPAGVNLEAVEAYWIDRVRGHFASQPFKIKLDASRALRAIVRDVIEQALERQRREASATYYSGAVLQHMVGAKLECAIGQGKIEHNSFSTADAPAARPGDFLLGDVAIHVTTSPSQSLIQRCADNLNEGHRPLVVTLGHVLPVAQELARQGGIEDRVDVFEIEQFVALNLYEIGGFIAEGRRTAVSDFVTRYNAIIEEVETDPSLRIDIRR